MLQTAVLILGFTVSTGSNVALFLYVASRVDKLAGELTDFKLKMTEALAEKNRLVR